MTRHDDADEIRRSLENRLESVLETLFPGWETFRGKGYLTPKNKKDLGSFQVNLTGHRRGSWYRFSQQVGGGTVELISYALTNGVTAYAQAFAWARSFLGIEGRRQTDEEAAEQRRLRSMAMAASAESRQVAEQVELAKREARAETAGDIWAHCLPIEGTLAEDYLVGRGVPRPPGGWPDDAIGFHRSLRYDLSEERLRFPCLVGRVQDLAGDTTAVWRIYLDPLTGGKAPVDNPKLGFGPASGGAVRIGGKGSGKIGVAEGLETALAAWLLVGCCFPVWATLSTSFMMLFEPPFHVKRLVIFPDGDPLIKRIPGSDFYEPEAIPPGIRAARALKARMGSANIPTTINELPSESDYLDVWRSVSGHINDRMVVA